MTSSHGVRVDVDLLGRYRQALLADAAEIRRHATLDRPDSGDVRAVTDAKLERIEARGHRLAELLTDLADALDRWLATTRAVDGDVAVGLDLLTSRELAL